MWTFVKYYKKEVSTIPMHSPILEKTPQREKKNLNVILLHDSVVLFLCSGFMLPAQAFQHACKSLEGGGGLSMKNLKNQKT